MKTFPPHKFKYLDNQSASNFIRLINDFRTSPVTLMIGSGVSASAGLPIWKEFLKRVCGAFFDHWESLIEGNRYSSTQPPKELSITGVNEDFWTESTKNNTEILLENDPVLIAQQIRNCIRNRDWFYLLRKCLYNNEDEELIDTSRSILIDNIAKLCAEPDRILSVINYNYDSTLEDYLSKYDIKFSKVYEENRKTQKGLLRVFHPHGYLGLDGGSKNIILTESDYHFESTIPYSWANIVQMRFLCDSTCIFVGLSMTDPNLRRLLRSSVEIFTGYHYVFLPCSQSQNDHEKMLTSLFDLDLLKLGVKTIRYPKNDKTEDPYSRLPDLFDILLLSLKSEKAIWENKI